jgi:hypothetical protein
MNHPDSPEAVVLALLDRILDRDDAKRGDNRPTGAALLDLYAECLAATTGRRQAADTTLH